MGFLFFFKLSQLTTFYSVRILRIGRIGSASGEPRWGCSRQDTWALSTRWSPWSHVSEICEAHFQIGAVFINKPQIWDLNNYILTWNTFKTTFHDTITVIF